MSNIFTDMISGKRVVAELEKEIIRLQGLIEPLEKDKAAAAGASQLWAQEKEDLVKSHTDASAKLISEHTEAMSKQKTDFEVQITNLNKKVETAEASSNRKAGMIVAEKMGVATDVIKDDTQTFLSKESAKAKFESLEGVEKTLFYRQHKALINCP